MRRGWPRALLLLVLVPGLAAAQPVEARRDGPVLHHRGMCEASGAVALPRGSFGRHFAVANDEDNVLRVYAADRDGSRTARLDFDALLEARGKADLEAAAWLGDRIYWLGSHSRNGRGMRSAARQRLFATVLRGSEEDPDLIVAPGTRAIDLLPALGRLEGLSAAIGGPQTDPALSPDGVGLNLEGLAAGTDGSLLLGLRGPQDGEGRAILIPLLNPAEAVGGAEVVLGRPIPLDLGGRGVRSLERIEASGDYLILAGPRTDAVPAQADGGPGFRLYRWSGRKGVQAAPLEGADAVLRGLLAEGFTPEAMIVSLNGEGIQLLSDDGRRRQDGVLCEDLPASAQEFRSVILRLNR